MSIEAKIILRDETVAGVGRDRIRLLQTVAREGSITAAAKAVGMTYKAAWDAIDAMTNLFGRPLLQTRSGGKAGGGAALTPAGVQVIEAFGRLESEMERVLRALEPELDGSGISPINLVSGFFMKTSARNAFHCTVHEVRPGTVNSEVILRLTEGVTLAAVITDESMHDLGIVIGQNVTALIKSSFVMLACGESMPNVSARNRIPGTVTHREDGPVSSEITLDIGGGKSITSMVTRDGADELALSQGSRAWALFKASHVILAVD